MKINWKVSAAVAAFLAILVGGLIWHAGHSSSSAEDITPTIVREVVVKSVAELSGTSATLPVVGTIRSEHEAQIRAESGGSIVSLNNKLGDFVIAGHTIAETENSSQRAALLQAEGALDAAKASVPIFETSLDSAKGGALTTLLSAYATVDSAITNTADQMFSNPDSANLQFTPTVANSQAKLNVENMRISLRATLDRETAVKSTLSKNSDLMREFSLAETELRRTRDFTDQLLVALNSAVSSPSLSDATIATYKANVTAARSSLTSSLTAITSASAGIENATNNLNGNGGGTDVSSSQAALKQAQGAYNAALANLDKTIIRSPISGSINNLSIHLGDFVSAFQQVAVVSNNGSLEAVTYVTEEDRSSLSVGSVASIEGSATGTIARVAPALDPVNHQIEVRIALPRDAHFANGQSVHIDLSRSNPVSAHGSTRLPISSLKMSSDGTFVFTLNEKNELVAHAIKTGDLSGDTIIILDGVSPDMNIVVDARGLKEGDTVSTPVN